MAAAINVDAYSDALVVLGTAGILVPLLRRIGVNPVLAYLVSGAVLGPLGLGSLKEIFPALRWFTVVDAKNVAGIAELGIVFLLFLIGLNLSFQRLVAMRRLVLGLGTLQVLLTTALIAAGLMVLDETSAVAAVLGATLSLSSTAIVLEILSRERRLGTHTGRTTFSVLLAQDLAVVPILMFISILGAQTDGSVMASLARALLQAAVALVAIVIIGRMLLRPLFAQAARAHTTELFIAMVLFVIVASGLAAHQAGLSMALGAFVAGLLLAETEFVKTIEATMEPFKGLLLGIFFFTVGMNIDIHELMRDPWWLAVAAVGLLVAKFVVTTALARAFRLGWGPSLESALLLAPGSEFAFVGISLAMALGLVSSRVGSFTLAMVTLTMALTPALARLGRDIASRVDHKPVDPELSTPPDGDDPKAIVVGFGRVGKVVCSLLAEHSLRFIAVDFDSELVGRERRHGHPVYYGNAADEAFLNACGLAHAPALIVTSDAHDAVDDIVRAARHLRPDLPIVARARDEVHARHLYSVGATTAVPETVEASFQLSEAALVSLGVAMGLAIASIHEKRDQVRSALRGAAERGVGN